MSVNAGDEFRASATPSQELLMKLSYLAAQDNGSVMRRGVASDDRSASEGSRRAARAAQIMTMQQQQEYQQRVEQMTARLDALDRASLLAMQEAEQRLEDIRRRANRTTDGRLVFEDEHGTLRDEFGAEVSRDEIDRASWRSDGARYEEWRAGRDDLDRAAEFHQRVQEQRDRMEANPNPDELDDIGSDIDDLEASMPEGVARHYEPPTPAADRTTSAAKQYDGGSSGLSTQTTFSAASAGAVTQTPPTDAPGPTTRPNLAGPT